MTISELEKQLETLRTDCIKEKNDYLNDNRFCACGDPIGYYKLSINDPDCCTKKKNKVRGVIEDIESKYIPQAEEIKNAINKLENEEDKKRRERNIEDRHFQHDFGIPPKYHGATIEDSGHKKEISDWWTISKGVLTLTGSAGTGKTRTIYALIRHLYVTQRGFKSPKVWSVPEFTKEIQGYHYCDTAWKETQLINDMANSDKIVIFDDLGAEKLTDATRQNLFIIIKKREEWEKRTLITTNLTIKEISESFDDRIASRLAGGMVLKYGGKDMRLQK